MFVIRNLVQNTWSPPHIPVAIPGAGWSSSMTLIQNHGTTTKYIPKSIHKLISWTVERQIDAINEQT
eukprot:3655269-Amphidinium_carterae.1